MKKLWQFIIAAAVVIALALGCFYGGMAVQRTKLAAAIPKTPHASATPEATKAAAADEVGRYIGKTMESAVSPNTSPADSTDFDLTSDGEKERVSLYSYPDKANGEATRWILEIKKGDAYYTLFNQPLNGAMVYYDLGKAAANEEAFIVIYTRSASGIDIRKYTYSKNGFVEQRPFTLDGVSIGYTSHLAE